MYFLKKFFFNERGNAAILAAAGLGAILAVSAFAIDYGHIQATRTKLKNAADAGALAGMNLVFSEAQDKSISVNPQVRDAIRQVARNNAVPLDEAKTLVELPDADLKFGVWNFDTNSFNSTVDPSSGPSPAQINTVQVTVRKDAEYNGRLTNFFWPTPTTLTSTSRAHLATAGQFW